MSMYSCENSGARETRFSPGEAGLRSEVPGYVSRERNLEAHIEALA